MRYKKQVIDTNLEIGPFGPIYHQFAGKANEAITFLLTKGNGEAVGALYHKEVGAISIVYGNEVFGLRKIKEKHPEVLNDIQGIMDNMAIIKQSDNRIKMESDSHFAVVSRDYHGEKHTPWLLTAFEKKNSVLDNTMNTGETLSGERNDTATPQNTVSNFKGSNNENTNQ